jgi:hypothetical protein
LTKSFARFAGNRSPNFLKTISEFAEVDHPFCCCKSPISAGHAKSASVVSRRLATLAVSNLKVMVPRPLAKGRCDHADAEIENAQDARDFKVEA